MKLCELKQMAAINGWDFKTVQDNIGMASFTKTVNGKPARINVYMTKMTVATSLDHPKQGKTQLYRRRVGKSLMKQIFENPRVHTDRGYQRRAS